MRKQWHWVREMKRLIVIGVIAVCASACGGDSAASTTVPIPVATTVAETTAATTTTSSTTSTTSTSSTTTTVPETTTTVPTEALIKQAVQDYYIAYENCGAAPINCAPEDFTALQGPSRETVKEMATGLVQHGLYFSTDLRGSYLVAEAVSVKSPTEAEATYCMFDAGIVLGPNGPDGSPTVVNDVIASVRYSYRLFLEGDAWLVGEQEQLERLGEGSLCPPAE